MKLTKWYPPHIKPTRKGVYQTQTIGAKYFLYSKWNGKWCVGDNSPEFADRATYHGVQNKEWRGIAK